VRIIYLKRSRDLGDWEMGKKEEKKQGVRGWSDLGRLGDERRCFFCLSDKFDL